MDSWVVIVWAYSSWRDGGGFVIASLSLTFGVVDLCGCLDYGRFRAVGRNSCSGMPPLQRCVGGLLHGGSLPWAIPQITNARAHQSSSGLPSLTSAKDRPLTAQGRLQNCNKVARRLPATL
ncbi:hypothetical protein NDU88_004999 [Pleurodeles waltl]|uniref:Secreted protein n=1 Tax=Pleurodeles waltl TaxID=8319 RepID=A0AAV7WXB0_PLEWA|nr:hypothetical protein NDU88_004999 [Pleurodeles waltl]